MTTPVRNIPLIHESSRPRWLLPALVAVGIAVALVLAGVVSLSTVLYVGMFGGMMLMHVGGHGDHGAHRANSGGEQTRGAGDGEVTTPNEQDGAPDRPSCH